MEELTRCSWCGEEVARDEGFRAAEPAGERAAAFCRLEHVVPWVIQGARWQPAPGPVLTEGEPARCAHCERALGEDLILLVRHRGEHRIADGLCGTEHLLEWAKAGGRWR